MSAASTPAPRAKSPTDSKPSTTRHTFFWPIFIYLFGAGSLALYQVMAMEDQWDQLTQTVDKMDDKVKRAQYEKAKFFHVAADVLRLAPRDPNAEQIVVRYKLRQLQVAQPELMGANTPSDVALSNITPPPSNPGTNAAPVKPAPATNTAPSTAPSPASR
jgi:hypothetical protein